VILNIAFKEFYNNLISARFVIGSLLCLFLIPLTLIVGIDDFKGKLSTYEGQKETAEKALKVKVYSALRPEIVRPPEPLTIFSRGISYQVGNQVKIQLGSRAFMAEGQASVSENPLMNSFFSLDFCMILALVLSLLALLFTYDSCSGEREEGTLKLVLSNSLARSSMLLGKVLGAGLTLLPILLFCYLLSALIILLSSDISFTASEWARVGLLLVVSVFYFLLFVLMGLFISSRFRLSAASIVVCLIAWVFFLFIVPNLSGYLAGSLVDLPSRENLDFAVSDINKEYREKMSEYEKTLPKPDWMWQYNVRGSSDGVFELCGASYSLYEWTRQTQIFSQPLLIDYADKKWPLQKAYVENLDKQRSFAEGLSLVSPSQVFLLLCDALCSTDAAAQERFLESCRKYRDTFIQYYRDKNLFASFLYFTPIPAEKFMTTDELIDYVSEGKLKSLRELNDWVAANPDKDFYYLHRNLINKRHPDWDRAKWGDLDISDVPKYQPFKAGVALELESSLVKITALLIVGVLLFFLSFISFIKYDVR
jgi:ABC-type transport system involved in multi-copper enzyme maturation permease subunit